MPTTRVRRWLEIGNIVKARCFEEAWIDFNGVKLLLYRLKNLLEVAEISPEELKSLAESPLDSDNLLKFLKRLPGSTKLKSECDLIFLDLQLNGIRYSTVISKKRLKCVPAAHYPDAVKSIEVFLRSSEDGVPELDFLQRSTLSRKSLQLDVELYASCFVGEVSDPNVVAVGVELLESGYRTILASELKDTYVKGESRIVRKRRSRKKRTRRRKKKES